MGRQPEIHCFMHDSLRNTYTELLHLKPTVQWSASQSLVSDTDLNPRMFLTFRDSTVTVCTAPITSPHTDLLVLLDFSSPGCFAEGLGYGLVARHSYKWNCIYVVAFCDLLL